MNKILSVLLLVLLTLSAYAQSSGQKNLDVANAFFKKKEYSNAIEYYLRSYNGRKRSETASQLAVSYMKLRNYDKANKWFKQALKSNGAESIIYFYYAQNLKSLGDYRQAKQAYSTYLKKRRGDEVTDLNFLISCDSSMFWQGELPYARVKNLNKLNTYYSEACPMIFKEKLIFSSNRENTFIKNKDPLNNRPYYNLYLAGKKTTNKWLSPRWFSSAINSSDHETSIAFLNNFDEAYITRGTHEAYKKDFDDQVNHLKLYKSVKEGKKWSGLKFFTLNDSTSSFAHPTFSSDGSVFIFSSNMKGGYGGMDLYITFKVDSSWTQPLNLGGTVNSAKDELYPYIVNDKDLYFSSNGHIGFGGFDLFKVTLENGNWVRLTNLKHPINSSYDDFSLIIDSVSQKGYFSSNRPGGKGEEDLYEVIFYE